MSSILKVDTIQNSSGTTGLTIDNSGRVLNPNVVAWFLNKTSSQTDQNLLARKTNFESASP